VPAGRLGVLGGEYPAVHVDHDALGWKREVKSPAPVGVEFELALGLQAHNREVASELGLERGLARLLSNRGNRFCRRLRNVNRAPGPSREIARHVLVGPSNALHGVAGASVPARGSVVPGTRRRRPMIAYIASIVEFATALIGCGSVPFAQLLTLGPKFGGRVRILCCCSPCSRLSAVPSFLKGSI
jgi:hypothetical protein